MSFYIFKISNYFLFNIGNIALFFINQHCYVGTTKVFENLVFNHLSNKGYKIHIGKLRNLEIDFVAQKNEDLKYIQVAYLLPNEKVREREFGNLLKIKDNYDKIVISADEFISGNYKGVKHIHILDFLTQ